MFKKIAITFALLCSSLFAQQSCPSLTVPVTTAAFTFVNNTPSYGICLNPTNGYSFLNQAVNASVVASACGGLATLISGTKTVSTTCPIAATDLVILSRQASNGSTTVGVFGVGTITNGTSFVINAYTAGTASTVAVGDTSIVAWHIIHTF